MLIFFISVRQLDANPSCIYSLVIRVNQSLFFFAFFSGKVGAATAATATRLFISLKNIKLCL